MQENKTQVGYKVSCVEFLVTLLTPGFPFWEMQRECSHLS